GGLDNNGEPRPDTITIRFKSDGLIKDCPNNKHNNNISKNRLAINLNGSPPRLTCNTKPLVSNVETMQIRYGLDTDGDNSVDRYTHDLKDSEKSKVRSVRV